MHNAFAVGTKKSSHGDTLVIVFTVCCICKVCVYQQKKNYSSTFNDLQKYSVKNEEQLSSYVKTIIKIKLIINF